MKFSGLAFLCACLSLVGCKGGSVVAVTPAPTPTTPSAPAPVEKVKITDVVLGSGKRTVEPGDTVWFQYKGTLNNGTVFGTNMSQDAEVLSFTVGQGAVIQGWDTGLLGMHLGGERKLVVPPSLGYGPDPHDKIPGNSTLNFDIKLLGLVKVGQEDVIDYTDSKVGSGPAAKDGNLVTIQYVGSLLNGKVFEDSKSYAKPIAFTIGKDPMLPCIEEGVRGMKVGGVRTVIAPPNVAYTNRQTKDVPPNSEVVFKITLVSMK